MFVPIHYLVLCLVSRPHLRLWHKYRYLLATECATDLEVAHRPGEPATFQAVDSDYCFCPMVQLPFTF